MLITSLDNKKVKEWTKLHNKKYRENEYLLLSEELVLEAYKNNYLKTLIYVGNPPFEFKDSYEVSKEVMEKISKDIDLKVIGIGLPIKEEIKKVSRVMILEDLQDPLNIGRIFESAYLFNFDMIILSNNCADIYNSKCLLSAGKCIYNVAFCQMDVSSAINDLKKEGFKIYSTGLKSYSKELYEVEPQDKMAFILGNEGSGVKEETFEKSDDIIKIDMHNIDSLNVAMAGAIIMYRFSNI